jgi:hypothetical protein
MRYELISGADLYQALQKKAPEVAKIFSPRKRNCAGIAFERICPVRPVRQEISSEGYAPRSTLHTIY